MDKVGAHGQQTCATLGRSYYPASSFKTVVAYSGKEILLLNCILFVLPLIHQKEVTEAEWKCQQVENWLLVIMQETPDSECVKSKLQSKVVSVSWIQFV